MKNAHRPFVLLGLISLSAAAAAQDPSSKSDIDNIIVTGARTPVSVSDIGTAATVITRDDIDRRQVRFVSDLLRTVPGFAVSQSGGIGTQTQVRVRGAEANHVLVLIDGVRANDPASGDEFRWEQLSTGNIERIEIVRGPQSSLWGSDALAAVVHVITRNSQQSNTANVFAETGSFGTGNVGARGVTNLGRLSLQGGIDYLETDGTNIARVGDEEDGADLTTVTLGANFAANDALTLRADVRAVDATSAFDSFDFFTTGLPADSDNFSESDALQLNLGANYGRDNSRFAHNAYFRFQETENANLAGGVQGSSTMSERANIGYQLEIDFEKHRLSLAAEHETTDFSQRGEVSFGDPNQDQEIDTNSFIAELQGNTIDRLTWIVSARFDDNSEFDDSTTGRLSLAWQQSGNLTLRASVGTAQKNPTFIERFGFFPAQFVGNPGLKPEESTSWEIGFDQRIADGAIALHATAYWQDLENEVNGFVFDPVTFAFTAENIDGESDRSGLETGISWTLNEQLDIRANYTYTDTTEPDGQGVSARELRRPRHAGNLSINFSSRNQRFSTALVGDYGGTRQDVFFPPFPAPSENVTMSNYWLVDLNVQFRVTESLTLFARGSNLLDEDYEQVYGFNTPGVAGYFGVRAEFGQDGR